jgi:glutamate carboxypeptidase
MLGLIEELVNIESGSYHKRGVDQVGEILAARLRLLGFELERHTLSACGDRYVGTRRLAGEGRLLVLGHTDTVWPEGTLARWPFSMRDGRATGPGVGDMKGGLVMALYALQALFEAGFDALESIRFMLVPDEELGSPHSREAIERAARDADWVLVLEPGRPGGGVVTARGALGAFFVHAHGQDAHCAVNHHKGASAVRELARKVVPLEALSEPDAGAVINVGVFQGGVAKQVIPGNARMDIDLRARTDEHARVLRDGIRRIAGDVVDPRVRVEITGGITRPAFTNEHNRALYSLARDVAAGLAISLFEVPPTGGGSDGNFAAALGVPTLDGLGPVTTDICTPLETIDIASLADRGAMFCGIVQQLPTTKGN